MRILLVLVAAVLLPACASVEKKTVLDLHDASSRVLPQHLKYLDADTAMDPDRKDDQKKQVEAMQRAIDALKNSVK